MTRRDILQDLLHWALDGDALTGVGARAWRRAGYRPRRPELIDRACWMRAGGATYREIATALGTDPLTASMYVSLTEPALHYRGAE